MDGRMGALMVKKVLMIAYHFPPLHGSSGIQRTLKFSKYLPEFGWEPVILSAHPRAFPSISRALMAEIPEGTRVVRAFAFDAARHLSVGGKYPMSLALPDRWASWWLGGVPAGLRLIRECRPDLIWSTYPIATAHLIGLTLNRLTGIPWVADFRDPMTDANYPPEKARRDVYRWIERRVMENCSRAVFTTPGAVKVHRNRYPDIPKEKIIEISNGYDEENFASISVVPQTERKRQIVLLHSGIIYSAERDPTQLFAALSALSKSGRIHPEDLKVVLRATQNDRHLEELISAFGIGKFVELAPPIPYQSALAEMLTVDALLILQASNCNQQIPAKLYEYLRAQKPILALTDPKGDTASTLMEAGVDTIAPLDSKDAIIPMLMHFMTLVRNGTAPITGIEKAKSYSRRAGTKKLADLFEDIAGS